MAVKPFTTEDTESTENFFLNFSECRQEAAYLLATAAPLGFPTFSSPCPPWPPW